MSALREQLRQASAEYQAIRYPGDLAAEMLGARRQTRSWRIVASSVSAAGMAAAILLAVLLYRPIHRPPLPQPPLALDSEGSMRLELPGMPVMPVNLAIVPQTEPGNSVFTPEYQAFTLPAMPSFPSWEPADGEEDKPTTQEAV